MSALLNVVLPVALIVAVGVIAGRRLPIDVASLTKLTLYVFAPALAADAMYRAQLGAGDAVRIFIAFSLTTFALYLFSRVVAQISGLDVSGRKSLIATTIFPNSGNFGLSLTLLALGQEGLERGFVTFAASALFVFGLGPGLVSGQGVRQGIITTLRLPMIWALIVGIGLRAGDVTLPKGIADGLHLLAGATVPTLLITLGLQISRQKFAVLPSDITATAMRLIGGPSAAYLAGRVVGLDHLALQVLVLQCATPTAVNALLISAEFGGDARKAARVVVLSSLVCFATIPIVMALMGID
ncbi:MAG TPA: AEC family transporter [Thermomicrobiales bacterium]|nr:AEC family transporter [Thermomicrobiales bacterium]